MFVDVHCHLDHEYYHDKLDAVIERAKNAHVKVIITSGTTPSSNRRVLALAKKYDRVKCSLGVYPTDAVATEQDVKTKDTLRYLEPFDVQKELQFIRKHSEDIIAIGEAGIDNLTFTDRLEQQKKNFSLVLELAEKLNKPLVLHTRRGEKEVLEMLESSRLKKINLHCFTGNMKLVKKAEEMGCYFSIPAVIQRLKHFQDLVQRVSINNLLTETDGPYLAPTAEGRSEPADVVRTVDKIAEIKSCDKEETQKIIFKNFQNCFM